jgi:phosphohistidine phosphatase
MDEPQRAADLELYLLRHAHAGNSATWHGTDAARPLSRKGRRQAEQLGAFLAERAFAPDAILTSPKVRARQTAELVADALGIRVTVDDRLAGPLDVDVVSALVEGAGGTSIVLVGHDPDFSELAARLSGAEYLPVSKGALVRIDIAMPIDAATGILRWLLPPDLVAGRS